MKNIKISLKGVIFLILICLECVYLYINYKNYKELQLNKQILIENKIELNKKIEKINNEKIEKNKKIQSDLEQINVLTEKLKILSIKNEAEFKKIIYIFSKESGLKLQEISKSEIIWERENYKLKYIHFTLYGSLNDFGKFLFFINKSKKYIDTTKTYIDLTGEGFKISLGFIENSKIVVN